MCLKSCMRVYRLIIHFVPIESQGNESFIEELWGKSIGLKHESIMHPITLLLGIRETN